MKSLLTILLLCLWTAAAHAHEPSDSYLRLARTERGLEGEWDIALYDLAYALELDGDRSGSLSWGEVRVNEQRIVGFAHERLTVGDGRSRCSHALQADAELALVRHSDGPYVRLPVALRCLPGRELRLHYDLLFDLDAQHRGFVHIGAATHVLDRQHRSLSIEAEMSSLAIVRAGMEHIFAGLDHLLFLLALLLPGLLASDAKRRVKLRDALLHVGKVVTSFTAAHSLTLAIASLGLVTLEPAVVEPAIAITVAIAAALNLRTNQLASRASIAFVLGLLHGFGFSSALSDLGLRGGPLLSALFAFNAGIELGQLAAIIAFVPLALLVQRLPRLSRWTVRGGSLAISGLALLWAFERFQQG